MPFILTYTTITGLTLLRSLYSRNMMYTRYVFANNAPNNKVKATLISQVRACKKQFILTFSCEQSSVLQWKIFNRMKPPIYLSFYAANLTLTIALPSIGHVLGKYSIMRYTRVNCFVYRYLLEWCLQNRKNFKQARSHAWTHTHTKTKYQQVSPYKWGPRLWIHSDWDCLQSWRTLRSTSVYTHRSSGCLTLDWTFLWTWVKNITHHWQHKHTHKKMLQCFHNFKS